MLLTHPAPPTMIDSAVLDLTYITGIDDESDAHASEFSSENTSANEETPLCTNSLSLLYEKNK